jgi:hypothetical protein
MAEHYVPVAGGDRVLIDLGGYGLELMLDPEHRWYDGRYVGIQYDGDEVARPELILADVQVQRGRSHTTVSKANAFRVWRHAGGEKRP